MKSYTCLLFLLFIFISHTSLSQLGTLKGTVKDKATNEPIPYATIILELNGSTIAGASSDYNGNYIIKGIEPGVYDLKVTFVGYKTSFTEGIVISMDKITFYDVKMESTVEMLEEVLIVDFKVPLISRDQTQTGSTVTAEEIERMPNRSASGSAATVGGVAGIKKSKRNARGARSNGTFMFIDGIRVSVPKDHEFNTESYDEIVENEFRESLTNPLSTFSVDVDRASYANVRRYLNYGTKPPPGAVRIEEIINYFDYDYPQPENKDPFSVNLEMAECPWNNEHELLMVGLQGKELDKDEVPPSNLVFLIDVSGSMSDFNKLPLLQRSFDILVKNLRKEDMVSIVVYAGSAGLVLEPTPGNNKKRILEAINRLHAGGSTAGGRGIKLAYKIANENYLPDGNNRVILATDGDFNVGVSNDSELVKMIEKKRDDGIFLTILSFGMGNYKDSKMEKLSNKGNGNYAYIDNINEARKIFGKELYGTLFTIAKDVKIQIEFNPAKVRAYRLIGYENRMLAKEDFNDDTKDAGEIGSGHTVTALYEIIPAGSDEKLPSADSLKYQVLTISDSEELLTVKLRYKDPDAEKSKLIQKCVTASDIRKEYPGMNFVLASCAAEFGMILRESAFNNGSDYKDVLARTKVFEEHDEYGYKAEFIKLVKKAKALE